MISGIKEGRSASQVFDISVYLNDNADLKAAFGRNYWRAMKHFVENGRNEKRAVSPILDVKYYTTKYSDLASMNSLQAMSHLLKNGMTEGRRGSEEFDPSFYFNYYSDLALNGVTKATCYKH